MHQQVVAVEPKGFDTTNPAAAPADRSAQPAQERRCAKFMYPGGARPLEGYTLKRGIGQGGFGEIYYAVSDAGKEVALKLIRRNLDVELRGIRQCLNLKHPNLLDLYDIRQDGQGDTWVVMEYVSGDSLETALAAHPHGLPLDYAVAWLHGIAAGVAYLHDRGIVHRDLKPGNIFSTEGLVKVGDYGLSKFISCSRRSGQTESIGTVHYMAPEVANGRYGKEIDIYALGIILYEMLTGRVPFDGESVGEVLMKHLTAKPDVSMLAEPFRSVIARALEKDPAKRFRSVAEMLAALPAPTAVPPGAGRLPWGGCTPAAAAGEHLAQTVVMAEAADEEPILRAVRQGWRQVGHAWNQANLGMPVTVILLLIGVFLLLHAAAVLIPLAIGLCLLYIAYRLVRMVVLGIRGPSTRQRWSAEPPQCAAPQTTPSPRGPPVYAAAAQTPRVRPSAYQQAAAVLLAKSPRERFTDLLGSLLVSALAGAAMCVVMVLVNSYHTMPPWPEPDVLWWAQSAWLALMGIAGAWAVLIPAKFWEGMRGEAVPRRFILMVAGLVMGALAWGVAESLMVSLPHSASFPKPIGFRLPTTFYGADGHPLPMAYLACFGTMFLVVRWWRQADPLRPTRLSFWSLICSMVVAYVVAYGWRFPQPWLPMVAGTMSVSIQLASPWVAPRERLRRKSV